METSYFQNYTNTGQWLAKEEKHSLFPSIFCSKFENKTTPTFLSWSQEGWFLMVQNRDIEIF